MQFNSFTFLGFFALVLGVYYLPLPWRAKKLNLLLASYVFYAAWNPPFVILIWISTLADWYIARGIHASTAVRRRKLLLLLSLVVNLGMLGYFKYGGFLLENFQDLLSVVGIDFQPALPDIVLPVGISFYTFQTLSYTLDVYRGSAKPWHSFLDYALYVTFFPQLVAGPIVRSSQFLPQCVGIRRATRRQFGWGLSLLVVGLFEKTVIADGLLAPIVEKVYDVSTLPGFSASWVGTLAFAGQIFCDFAGYSTCAIGVAMCFGFALPDNFRFPYAAIGFTDFWRRWHISLSTWLRDYLYISLGGNRRGQGRTYVNLMLTMLIGGLWHGASWTFVVWGGLHGLYLVVERWLKKHLSLSAASASVATQLGLSLLTFSAVCVAWVFFRSGTFVRAFEILGGMFGGGGTLPIGGRDAAIALGLTGGILATHWALRETSLEAAVAKLPAWVWGTALGVMILCMTAMPGEDRAFIYFQF